MSELITLETLFQEQGEARFFQVPDYQRGYSWEDEHRKDLLEDISDLLLHDATHFTGTIVAARPEQPDGAYQLVDGQQRLTSLVLLLSRLILRLEDCGVWEIEPRTTLDAVREHFIRSTERVGATRPRLELNTDTTALFQEVCLRGEIPSEHIPPRNKAETNLLEAARQFDQYLHEHDADQLKSLYRAITGRMGFLFYAPRNSTEIGLMFEVINSRGKPLSELDKVKNFLIYYANRHQLSDLHAQINDAWAEILANLNQVGITTNDEELMFLQACWTPFGDPRTRKGAPVYEGLKAKVAGISHEEGFGQLSAFVRLLRHGAQTFRYLYNRAAAADNTDESLWMERISFHPRLASVLPLVVALFYRENDREERTKALELIEKLNFRFYVLGIADRSDSRQSELNQLAYNYFHADLNAREEPCTTADLKEGLRTFVRDHAEIRRVIKNLVLEADESWDFYGWAGLKFFLASYEQSLCEARHHTKPLPELLRRRDPDTYNDFYHREHIVARNDHEDISDEVGEFIKRRLGNFVLTREGTNKTASNGRAVEKIEKTYRTADMNRLYQVIELNDFLQVAESFVSNERGWKRDAKGCREERLKRLMDKREEQLVEFALKRWHVPGVDPEEPPTVHIDSIFTGSAVWKRA